MSEDHIRAKQQRLLLERDKANIGDKRDAAEAIDSVEEPIGSPHAGEEWRDFYSAVKRITESMRI